MFVGTSYMMVYKFEQDLVNLVENVVNDKLENCAVIVHDGNKKGEGFLSDISFISLNDKISGEFFHLVIKKVQFGEKDSTKELMSTSFLNEIHYYREIFPILQTFQKTFSGVKIFDNFPKLLATCSDKGNEKIILQNLKYKNYEVPQKSAPFEIKTFEKIFKLYADFHALSFAFKHHNYEKFFELTEPLHHSNLLFSKNFLGGYIKSFFRKVTRFFENQDEEIVGKLQKYFDQSVHIYENCMIYEGSKSVILHGDCWSNNLMFKYNVRHKYNF